MRVLFDALAATAKSGGMRLHATQFVKAWGREFPEDYVALLAPPWAKSELGHDADAIYHWPNESVLTRAPGQLILSALVASRLRADAIVSLSPIVTPIRRPGRKRVAFQHDWRHIKYPDQFSRAQRMYRGLWRMSARWADVNACISAKAERETLAMAPGCKTLLAFNGGDHALAWKVEGRRPIPGRILTFGHHNNKRPELMIEALSLLPESGNYQLYVLGAEGKYKRDLEAYATRKGVRFRTTFPGFVSNAEYEILMAESEFVALVSCDEGFGLPIAEAQALGAVALIAEDSGMSEVFGSQVVVVRPSAGAIAQAIENVRANGAPILQPSIPRWADAVRRVRAALG